MVAKAGLGLIGLSAIGIGGVAVTKPHLLGMDYMPEFHALSKDHNFSSAGYDSGKLGNKFKNYLVGVTNKKEGNNKTNQGWWDWAVRKLNKEKTKPKKFENVEIGYSDQDNNKALNQVCKQAYKEDYSSGFSDTETNKFSKSDVWKYCSPLDKEPSKIGDNKYKGKIGESIKSEAISVEDKENDMFWSIREKEVQGKDDNFTKVPSTDISSTHFKNRDLDMKELCRQAYETQTNSAGTTPNPSTDDTKKYCKFEIS